MQEKSAGNPAMLATERERKIIQSTFKDNETLLKAIRAVFLNLNPTPEEIGKVRSLPDDVKAIIRDRFLPSLDKNSPIGQVKDVWMGAEQMVFGTSRDAIVQGIQYKNRAIEMTKNALGLLDGDGPKVDVAYRPSGADDLGIDLLTRNQFIRHVEQQLYALWIIASQKEETPQQVAKRAHKDSVQ